MFVLGADRAYLYAHPERELTPEEAARYEEVLARRATGMPSQYITGHQEFWGLDFVVSPAVLIPRPETETVVEAALARLSRERPLRVLDLGTGSGAIALAVARERPNASVIATDVSTEALEVARGNAARLGIGNVAFIHSDWYAALDETPFDLIASNPPYVAPGDPHLSEGDLRFEPRHALVASGDALSALRAIVFGAHSRLASEGWLLVEHGYDQAVAVRGLFETAGFGHLQSLRDLAGIERVVVGRRPR